MQLDPSGISNDLENETTNHADQEAPCAIADAQKDLDDKHKSKQAEVESISGQGGHIGEVRFREWTGPQLAEIGWIGPVYGHDRSSAVQFTFLTIWLASFRVKTPPSCSNWTLQALRLVVLWLIANSNQPEKTQETAYTGSYRKANEHSDCDVRCCRRSVMGGIRERKERGSVVT